MKSILITLILSFSLTSCLSEEQRRYKVKYWEYKAKDLELEHWLKIQKAKNILTTEQRIQYLDSLSETF